MTNKWTERWDERYRQKEYAYGESPNLYLKEQLEKLEPGKILFPAEGEGRNAVFAAKLGWTVFAFDISTEGRNKAMQLAQKNNVSIDYQVGDLQQLNFKQEEFDAIALIYAHFPPEIRSDYHKKFDTFLRKNGVIILEAFSKKHIDYVTRNPNVGGPKDLESLFSIVEIKNDFKNYDIIELKELEINLDEGTYHKGLGTVVRFVGRKK
ncbi:MAG TPA: class I SAM-dependent methyltransferase [Chitinophagaceae bacterium]|nr:class I SAM-dependent methyltransferase [Chitinophagaceae bacterium]